MDYYNDEEMMECGYEEDNLLNKAGQSNLHSKLTYSVDRTQQFMGRNSRPKGFYKFVVEDRERFLSLEELHQKSSHGRRLYCETSQIADHLQRFQDGVFQKFENQNSKTPQEDNEQRFLMGQEILSLSHWIYRHPKDTISYCCSNYQHSKEVEHLIHQCDGNFLGPLMEESLRNINYLFKDQHGSHMISALVEMNHAFARQCESYCLTHLKELSEHDSSVKIMQSLAINSPNFCRIFSGYFIQHFDFLINRIPVIILINKCILNYPVQKNQFGTTKAPLFTFLICRLSELLKTWEKNQAIPTKMINLSMSDKSEDCSNLNPDLVSEHFDHNLLQQLLRVTSSLLEKLDGTDLKILQNALMPHIEWLLENRIGNFAGQALLSSLFNEKSRKWKKIKAKFANYPYMMFRTKQKRVAFTKSLKQIECTAFLQTVFLGVLRKIPQMMVVFKNESQTQLLIGLHLRMNDRKSLILSRDLFIAQHEFERRYKKFDFFCKFVSDLNQWILFLSMIEKE